MLNRRSVAALAAGVLIAGPVVSGMAGAAEPGKSPPAGGEASPAAEKGFESLFNGKDVTGWKPVGNAEWLVRDGCLVGTQTDGRGGDLFHEKAFDHFDLRFTYRVKWPANTGVWFRYDKGKGYQYDILKWPKPVAFSGTLYCHGKMFLTTNPNEAIERRDDWNEGRVWAQGDHLILWLNGKRVGETHDTTCAKGQIGIQVHGGGGFKGMEVVVRKIEIRSLAAGEKAPAMTDEEKPPAGEKQGTSK
jgi:hypothetical protein